MAILQESRVTRKEACAVSWLTFQSSWGHVKILTHCWGAGQCWLKSNSWQGWICGVNGSLYMGGFKNCGHVVKIVQEPRIWEWFITPIYDDLGDGLWHCVSHVTPNPLVSPWESDKWMIVGLTAFLDWMARQKSSTWSREHSYLVCPTMNPHLQPSEQKSTLRIVGQPTSTMNTACLIPNLLGNFQLISWLNLHCLQVLFSWRTPNSLIFGCLQLMKPILSWWNPIEIHL